MQFNKNLVIRTNPVINNIYRIDTNVFVFFGDNDVGDLMMVTILRC